MISEIYGKKTGCSSGVGGSIHLIDLKKNFLGSTAIVSNSIPIGVGYAYSLKYFNKILEFVYILEMLAAKKESFWVSKFAIIKKLPIIFLCENNKYSVYSNLKQRQ